MTSLRLQNTITLPSMEQQIFCLYSALYKYTRTKKKRRVTYNSSFKGCNVILHDILNVRPVWWKTAISTILLSYKNSYN